MIRTFSSPDYNYKFDTENGFFARWGKTLEDDPQFSPVGPEILDIEVTTICKGPGGKLCPFCYKSNNPNGRNMSLETFKAVINKMPKSLTQCAIGADAQATSNPDLFAMMDYCRTNNYNRIVPNITVADITDETADELIKRVGAVAVSRYANKDLCYDSVKRLTDRGLEQTNIHVMISQETFDIAMETIRDRITDPRLSKLHAIVLLSLKKKGRGTGFHPLTKEQFKELVDTAFGLGVAIGFDSCSAPKFLQAVKGRDNYKQLEMVCEPCESSCFSAYVSVDGEFFPCSFVEGEAGWEKGIPVANCKDFMDDVWFDKRVVEFRQKLLAKCRECPVFEV